MKTSRRAEHLPFLNALAFKNEGLFSEIKLYRLHFRYELQREAKGLTVLAAFVAKPGGGSQITGVALYDTVAWILRVWHQNLPGHRGKTSKSSSIVLWRSHTHGTWSRVHLFVISLNEAALCFQLNNLCSFNLCIITMIMWVWISSEPSRQDLLLCTGCVTL